MSGWAFHQLTSFIEYKARLAGVVFEKIDPRNTSRTCSECGYCDKKNRKNQAEFVCLNCGHSENADLNAAKNIAKKAVVSAAKVASVDGETAMCRVEPELTQQKPPALASGILMGPQKGPTSSARLRAQWRQVDRENAQAREVRREWMALLGCDQAEIDEVCQSAFDLDLVDELEQLAAAKRLV